MSFIRVLILSIMGVHHDIAGLVSADESLNMRSTPAENTRNCMPQGAAKENMEKCGL